MPNAQQELAFLKLATHELQDFLLSQDVYWALPGISHYPNVQPSRLSMGALLLAIKRLQSRLLFGVQAQEFQALTEKIDAVYNQWRGNWEQKIIREFPARLRLWMNYLGDYQNEPENYYVDYPREVERRVMLELFNQDAKIAPAEWVQVDASDRLVQLTFLPGPFIWEAELARGFPASQFWFLYGTLNP